jgi:uncharacterized repeat protein (TIGR01451 family)
MGYKKVFLALCLACLAALIFIQTGLALPPTPMLVHGTVLWNGINVPGGTKVSAWCGSLKAGSATVTLEEGVTKYAVPVVGDDTSTTSMKEGCALNETVTFKLDTNLDNTWDFAADQTTTWAQGGITNLNLTTNPQPAITLQKLTNGQDVSGAPGPYILAGQTVTWNYLVTNSGNVRLSSIQVSDAKVSNLSCPKNSLNASEAMTCTASGTATTGQYTNTGSVIATSPGGLPSVNASDQSYYFGAAPAISIKKYTNGQDADTPATGPYIPVGAAVAWTYVTSNTGNVALTNVSVTDSKGVTVSCPKTSLAASESMTCTAQGTATAGQYSNTGTASGKYTTVTVSASDLSHYYGATLGLAIEARTNGQDADSPPGPAILVGQPVNWSYLVSNTSNVPLTGVTVSDSHGVTIACPKNSLAAAEAMTCTASGTATIGQYTNSGSASGTPPGGLPVQNASDLSHYFGADPKLTIETRLGSQEADTPPGAYILVGQPANLTYTVTNTGNIALSGISVSDSQASAVPCPKNSLAAQESMLCSISISAVAGQQTHTGTASTTFNGLLVSSSDPAYYFGAQTGLSIEARTRGLDADAAPGPYILVGQTVQWTYTITNTSNVKLTGVAVTDDQAVAVSCSKVELLQGESQTCTASGPSVPGQYANLATVTGTPPGGLPQVSSSDPSHYFGAQPGVTIEARTNDQDADVHPGVYIIAGETVYWTYLVNNTGNLPLTAVVVTDNHAVQVTCPKNSLAVNEQMTCSASGTAILGQYDNTGSVTATPPGGLGALLSSDPSHYFGSNPGLAIEMLTNGLPADTPPGPYIKQGDTVSWTYAITNTGNVPLTEVVVTDSEGVTISCPGNTLATNAHMTCSASALAATGQYSNFGTVTANPPVGLDPVSASNPSHYIGYSQDPSLDIRKYTNDADANTAPGIYLAAGAQVHWTYVINNTGGVPLTNVFLLDDMGTPGNPADDTKVCDILSLEPLQTHECQLNGTAITGQYGNLGTVKGTFNGNLYSDTDPSYYFGSTPGIALELYANGQRADSPNGPYLLSGTSVSWTYAITNTGNVALTKLVMTDDQGTFISCPQTSLAVAAHMLCTASSTVITGQFNKTATATASPPMGLPNVTASDPAYYFGAAPALTLKTSTNGQDANNTPGPYILSGHAVSWTYLVTNSGNVSLTNVAVSDDRGVTLSCPKATLAVAEAMTCTASGTAASGQYTNLGTVTAKPPGSLSPISASDPSHYFGAQPGVSVILSTNGEDANDAPGPAILKGQPVSWTYQVSNSGNVALTAVQVSDDHGVPVNCPKATLALSEQMLCTASGTAIAGQYSNIATVSGTPPEGLAPVSDTDPSHYFGLNPQISLQVLVNGSQSGSLPGPGIEEGDTVTLTITVLNTGNVPLDAIALSDDLLGDLECPLSSLDAGDEMVCTASETSVLGQHTHVFTVHASYTGVPVQDVRTSYYLGIPAIQYVYLPMIRK